MHHHQGDLLEDFANQCTMQTMTEKAGEKRRIDTKA